MSALVGFYVQFFILAIVSVLILAWYVKPKLFRMDYHAALIPLMFIGIFRFLDLSFTIDAVTVNMPDGFSNPVGFGGLIGSVLALIAVILLRKKSAAGVGFAWVYTIFSTANFLLALYLGNVHSMPEHLGPIWGWTVISGPTIMVSLVFTWIVLLKHPSKKHQASA